MKLICVTSPGPSSATIKVDFAILESYHPKLQFKRNDRHSFTIELFSAREELIFFMLNFVDTNHIVYYKDNTVAEYNGHSARID
jgi:hypothetical protein